MLFTLGLDSEFAIVETLLTGILDYKPSLRPKKTLVVGMICFIGFILGLPLCCPGGGYLLDLLDYYAASWPYLFIGLIELVIIAYIYGYSTYIDDLFEMTKNSLLYKLKAPMSVFYCFLSPLVIFIIFIFSWYNYEPLTKGSYVYPGWANGIGWIVAMLGILPVPIAALYVFVTSYLSSPNKDTLEVLRQTTRHTVEWRQNAIRINNKDGEESCFEYRQDGDRMVRYRLVIDFLSPCSTIFTQQERQIESRKKQRICKWRDDCLDF